MCDQKFHKKSEMRKCKFVIHSIPMQEMEKIGSEVLTIRGFAAIF